MIRHLAIAPLAAVLFAVPASAQFRPEIFFQGRTRGAGTVKIVASSSPRALSVQSVGRVMPDGELVLDQAIRIDGKPSTRTFRIRRAQDGAYLGTLSDASGPVRATVTGNVMSLSYPMKRRGFRMNQRLTLQPGGRSLLNQASVTMLGIRVARIEERIDKVD